MSEEKQLNKDKSDTNYDRAEVQITIEGNNSNNKNDEVDNEADENEREKQIMKNLTEVQPNAFKGRRKFFVFYTVPTEGPPEYEYERFSYGPERNAFVRSVLLLVISMLAVTAAFAFMCYTVPYARRQLKSALGRNMAFMCSMGVLMVNYAIGCTYCAREVPTVYFFIFLGVCGYSYIVAFMTVWFPPHVVIGALLCTTVIVLICLGLAYTSFDFTRHILIVMAAVLAIVFGLLFCMFLKFLFNVDLTIARMVLIILSTLITSVILVIQLQMILGGKMFEFSESEYALAAYMVYLSIIIIFVNLVSLIGNEN